MTKFKETPKRKPIDKEVSEEAIQKTMAQYLRRAMPEHIPWTAIEPAGRGARDGARQKAKGVNAGWMDFQFILPTFGTYLGLEVKSKNGSPSQSQKENGALIEACGGFWFPVKSLGDVEYVLRCAGVSLSLRSLEKPRPHLVKLVEGSALHSIRPFVESVGSKSLDKNKPIS